MIEKTEQDVKKGTLFEHILIGIVVVGLVFVPLYLITPFFIKVFSNPQDYLYFVGDTEIFSAANFQVAILCIMAYVSITLVGYIGYLLVSSSTRAELIAEYKIKNISASQSQLEELYENAPVPYFTINQEGEIMGCNKSALRFFGVVPAEISGKNFFLFTAEEDRALGEKFLGYFKSNLPINKEEIRMITKTGGEKWVSLSIFLTKNFKTGEKNGLVTTFDITEQKHLDQAKTEFVSLASHQLRTPLATIKWYTEMLTSKDLGELNEKQKEYLNRMYSVNTEMIDLVEILLNVSRIEIGTLAIAKQITNVPEIVDGILVELASQIDKKKIKIKKNYNGALTNMDSDPKLLRIVIQNLITNAIKYNKDGGDVAITLDEGSGFGQSTISVSDTGFGIPKEDQERIFTKLFRAKNVANISNSQSTGLGLYLSKSIVEALGGNISFTSEENTGTSFTLKL